MLDLQSLVIDNLRSFNERLPVNRRLAAEPCAVVTGPDTTFDSLDTVEFLMGLEDEISMRMGCRLDICGHIDRIERDVITVGEVTSYIEQLVAQATVTVRAV